jgi:hypothetical protein
MSSPAPDPAALRHTFDMDLWDRVGTAVIQWMIDCEEPRAPGIAGPNSADYVMAEVQPALNRAKSTATDAACKRIRDYAQQPGIDKAQRAILRTAERLARGEHL